MTDYSPFIGTANTAFALWYDGYDALLIVTLMTRKQTNEKMIQRAAAFVLCAVLVDIYIGNAVVGNIGYTGASSPFAPLPSYAYQKPTKKAASLLYNRGWRFFHIWELLPEAYQFNFSTVKMQISTLFFNSFRFLRSCKRRDTVVIRKNSAKTSKVW